MAQLDGALLAPLLVDGHARKARTQEGDGNRQPNGVALIADGFEDDRLQLTVVEGARVRDDVIGRQPRGGGENIVCEGAVALTEAGLVALFEVVFLDRDCGIEKEFSRLLIKDV